MERRGFEGDYQEAQGALTFCFCLAWAFFFGDKCCGMCTNVGTCLVALVVGGE